MINCLPVLICIKMWRAAGDERLAGVVLLTFNGLANDECIVGVLGSSPLSQGYQLVSGRGEAPGGVGA